MKSIKYIKITLEKAMCWCGLHVFVKYYNMQYCNRCGKIK